MCNIRFSLPEQYGVTMYLSKDTYTIYPIRGRLTDDFFDELLAKKPDKHGLITFTLFNDEEREIPMKLVFDTNRQNLQIELSGYIKEYDISYDDFLDAFISHIEKYAIYFAAPCNYRAIMLLPFDEMVVQMKKYQPQADAILNKIIQK